MKIIEPGFEIFEPVRSNAVLAHIERCGRVCYKSEDKIKDGSAETFCRSLISRGHEAVIEHGAFCFGIDFTNWQLLRSLVWLLEAKGFCSYLRFTNDSRPLVSGNVRAWRDFIKSCAITGYGVPKCMGTFINENPVLFPEYQAERLIVTDTPGEFYIVGTDALSTDNEILTHRDMTVLFTVDRGVSHEIVRHRPASYCQESTRYCNYSKGEFGGEITVIKPCFFEPDSVAWEAWKGACEAAERAYFDLLGFGCSPQQARAVLPNSLKTEVVVTANIREWRHFFKLRCAEAAHPQMREVATQLLIACREKIPVLFNDIHPEVQA